MGWGYGTTQSGKEVGYSVPDVCNKEGCKQKIDRGLAYICGSMHGDGEERACNGYFCYAHLVMFCVDGQRCQACADAYYDDEGERKPTAPASEAAQGDKEAL